MNVMLLEDKLFDLILVLIIGHWSLLNNYE